MKSLLLLFSFLTFLNYAQISRNEQWKEVAETDITFKGQRLIIPEAFKVFSIALTEVRSTLSIAPMEFTHEALSKKVQLKIPFPDGKLKSFYVFESPIMAPELAAQFPELKTYIVEGIDKSEMISGRIDLTPMGFHAMVFTPAGTVFVDPYSTNDKTNYIVYYKKDFKKLNPPVNEQSCVVDNPEVREEIETILNSRTEIKSGEQLRTYRLALACTGEYAAFHGGTVAGAMNGIVTTINRVDGVYEKEVAVRMILIPNNSSIVYTVAGSDPYTNSNGSTMLGQNQTNIDLVIGSANYDIGHVFSTGGGGVAYLGCVCGGSKAKGVTGGPSPVGDPFDIDYVAHEMGHQFGGNHTFNSVADNCGGGNRVASAAYEPGSGSTIMAYAGICGADDLQPNSDPYFHIKSLNEIIAFTTLSSGNNCAVTTATGNLAPEVTVPTGGFTIPINTPFALTGSAVDGDSDPLMYCWEEFDLGPAGTPGNPSGNAPTFRSFNPVTSPTRTFPKLSNLLNNTTTIGEKLPGYARSLSFRLIARDNKMGGGGTGYNTVTFSVAATAGPFVVTYPNTNIGVPALSTQSITWNIAGTDAAPVSCSIVNIKLSTDGGQSWPITIAANTPNDGSESVIIPDNETTTARIKVEAADNIFFDISNTNFNITAATPVELSAFRVIKTKSGVNIEWETVTETNNRGFSIERSKDKKNFEGVTFVNGYGSSVEKKQYSYFDKSVNSGVYSYRLKQIDNDGTFKYSNVVDIDLGTPVNFSLMQNYPNPFNPTTNIGFNLPSSASVTLIITDLLGNQVSEVYNGTLNEGRHSIEFNAVNMSSGVYFYTLIAESEGFNLFRQTRKMVVIK